MLVHEHSKLKFKWIKNIWHIVPKYHKDIWLSSNSSITFLAFQRLLKNDFLSIVYLEIKLIWYMIPLAKHKLYTNDCSRKWPTFYIHMTSRDNYTRNNRYWSMGLKINHQLPVFSGANAAFYQPIWVTLKSPAADEKAVQGGWSKIGLLCICLLVSALFSSNLLVFICLSSH